MLFFIRGIFESAITSMPFFFDNKSNNYNNKYTDLNSLTFIQSFTEMEKLIL